MGGELGTIVLHEKTVVPWGGGVPFGVAFSIEDFSSSKLRVLVARGA